MNGALSTILGLVLHCEAVIWLMIEPEMEKVWLLRSTTTVDVAPLTIERICFEDWPEVLWRKDISSVSVLAPVTRKVAEETPGQ